MNGSAATSKGNYYVVWMISRYREPRVFMRISDGTLNVHYTLRIP